MIYLENDNYYTSLFRVVKVGGFYQAWSDDDDWEGEEYELYPNEGSYMQVFLAPTCLGFWSKE